MKSIFCIRREYDARRPTTSIHLILVLSVLFWTTVFGVKCHANEPDPEWKRDKAIIQQYANKHDCPAAFLLLWKHVRKGNKTAITVMSTYALWLGLSLPDAPKDGLFRQRLYLTLVVHGYHKDGEGDLALGSQNAVRFQILGKPLFSQFDACAKKTSDLSACVEQLKSKGVVPSLESFIDEIDGYLSRSSAKPICQYPKGP